MIYKVNFKLIVAGKEEAQNLLGFHIINSAKFHMQTATLKISNIKLNLEDKIELYLGYERLYPVFKGYITEISDKQIITITAKDEYLKLTQKKKIQVFNRTTPKEVISSIVKYPLIFTEKSFIQKHHFLIWNETIDEALRKIQKTWKLNNFVWFFDIDGNFHFHEFKKFKEYNLNLSSEHIKKSIPRKNYLEVILTKPLFDIYPLYEVKIHNKKYITETIIHKFENKKLTTSLYLSNLS